MLENAIKIIMGDPSICKISMENSTGNADILFYLKNIYLHKWGIIYRNPELRGLLRNEDGRCDATYSIVLT